MSVSVVDFLPKYPNIHESKYPFLNPYEGQTFESAIYHKKEFYDERLERLEQFPALPGSLLKSQKIIARYLSSYTPYQGVLLVHYLGTGKTCAAIGAIEQVRQEHNTFQRAMIFAKGRGILDNFVQQLLEKCTRGQYKPDNYESLSDSLRTRRVNESIGQFYRLNTFYTFASTVKKLSDEEITRRYNNSIVVVDEVHNLRIQPGGKRGKRETVNVYDQFHRFLHLIPNSKIILLSGTPMKDTVPEIASVMNLILPLHSQLPTGDSFMKEYMMDVTELEEKNPVSAAEEENEDEDEDEDSSGIYVVKESKKNELKSVFKGRVSYLRAIESDVKKEFVGDTVGGFFDHFRVQECKMSGFQTHYYTEAMRLDQQENKGESDGFFFRSVQAGMFVFPDGSYGARTKSEMQAKTVTVTREDGKTEEKVVRPAASPKGFDKYIEEVKGGGRRGGGGGGKYRMKSELRTALLTNTEGLEGKAKVNQIIKNVNRYSCKYYRLLKSIMSAKNKSCFVYSKIVKGSGLIVLSLILQLLGFQRSKGDESVGSVGLRYAILSNETTSRTEQAQIVKRFNQPDNMYGGIIKVILGSGVVSEGISFANIQEEFILTPHWNFSETEQAIGRGIRLNSHKDLVEAGVDVTVKIHLLAAIPRGLDVLSLDLMMYKRSEDKDYNIKQILRLIMEAAFDCALTYFRNRVFGVDGSRECEYTSCDYNCDGIDMSILSRDLESKEIDTSTYQLYYADKELPDIYRKIEALFRRNPTQTLTSLVEGLKDEYSEYRIINALDYFIQKFQDQEYTYQAFLETYLYSNSAVSRLMYTIEQFFQTTFRLKYSTIRQRLQEYTDFEIISALRHLIFNSVPIKDKYGFISYLREQNDVYFLTQSLASASKYTSKYYTECPTVHTSVSPEEVYKVFETQGIATNIEQLFRINESDNKAFEQIIATFPPNVQQILLEGSILAEERKITVNEGVRRMIYNHFESKVVEVDWEGKHIFVSTLAEPRRCYEQGDVEWKECDERYIRLLEQKHTQRLQNLRENNDYDLIGVVDPTTKEFNIIDLRKEQTAKGSRKVDDKRLERKGKNCVKSINKPILIDYLSRYIGDAANPPPEYKYATADEKTINELLEEKGKTRESIRRYYGNELWTLPLPVRRRIEYYSRTDGYGVRTLCDIIQELLGRRNYIIYQEKSERGEEKKERKEKKEREEKKKGVKGVKERRVSRRRTVAYRTMIYETPERVEELYKASKKKLKTLGETCFGKLFNVDDEKGNVWIATYKGAGKVPIGYLIGSRGGNVIGVCFNKSHQNLKAVPLVKQLFIDFSNYTGVDNPQVRVSVNNRKLLELYATFGLQEVLRDAEYVTFSLPSDDL